MPAVSGLLLAFDVGNTNTVIGLFDGKGNRDVFKRAFAFALSEKIEAKRGDSGLVQHSGQGFIGRAVLA